MTWINERYLLQTVDDAAVLADTHTGSEVSIPLTGNAIWSVLDGNDPVHGLFVGSLRLPPDAVPWFAYALGHHHMTHVQQAGVFT